MSNQDSRLLRPIAQLVGLGAGVVAAIYVCGAIVIALRQAIGELPIQNVVGQLPRDFVISIGLAQVALPALAGALVYGTYRTLRGKNALPPRWSRWSDADRRGRGKLILRALAWAIPLAIPGTVVPIVQEASGVRGVRWDLLLLLIPFALIFVTTLLARDVLRLVADRVRDGWNGVPGLAASSLVVFLATIPAWISLASAFSYPRAKVCTKGNDQALGLLIGQTSDQVFLGDTTGRPRPLVVIPQQEVAQLVVGKRYEEIPCFVSSRG
jgi:hypothetical protein